MGAKVSDKPELARRLVAARTYAGYSSGDQMADALDIGRSTVSRWETGKKQPDRFQLAAWAEACGVPVAFFTAPFELLSSESGSDLSELRGLVVQLLQMQQALVEHLLPQSAFDIQKLMEATGQAIAEDVESTRQALESDRQSGQSDRESRRG